MENSCQFCNMEFFEGESNPYVCQEFFKNDEFAVLYIFDEKMFIAVPLEYIDPRTKRHNELRDKMKKQAFKAAYEFYGESLDFHMHWGCPEQEVVELAGVKKPPCRLCLAVHKEEEGSCGRDNQRVILENEKTLQQLKEIGVIE